MHRRGFLGLIGAAIAAPFVPRSGPNLSGTFAADYGGFFFAAVDLTPQLDATIITRRWRREMIEVTMAGDLNKSYIPGDLYIDGVRQ